MENLLLKKLQIKAGFRLSVINAPENLPVILGDIPTDVEISYSNVDNTDAYLLFCHNRAAMFSALKDIMPSITATTIVWIFYPKAKTPLAADLNLMQSWTDLTDLGLAPCSSAAIDKIWTAIRVKPASLQKKSGLGNTEIAKSDYGKYIDVKNKIITLPNDLRAALVAHPTALAFYEQLAYSHRKEYVLWILSAKQEKTKNDRVNKMIEKLLGKKKNPTEK